MTTFVAFQIFSPRFCRTGQKNSLQTVGTSSVCQKDLHSNSDDNNQCDCAAKNNLFQHRIACVAAIPDLLLEISAWPCACSHSSVGAWDFFQTSCHFLGGDPSIFTAPPLGDCVSSPCFLSWDAYWFCVLCLRVYLSCMCVSRTSENSS